MKQAKNKPCYAKLLDLPGVGKILALTIQLETGPASRFLKVGNYASYCRKVESRWFSNEKAKGRGNAKNGNKYLAWAYVEAANFGRRFCPGAQRFYQRKLAKTNSVIAIKALANKIARASYFLMRDQVPFDEAKLFG